MMDGAKYPALDRRCQRGTVVASAPENRVPGGIVGKGAPKTTISHRVQLIEGSLAGDILCAQSPSCCPIS